MGYCYGGVGYVWDLIGCDDLGFECGVVSLLNLIVMVGFFWGWYSVYYFIKVLVDISILWMVWFFKVLGLVVYGVVIFGYLFYDIKLNMWFLRLVVCGIS